MNKLKNSKIILILSIMLVFLVIGSASAVDENSNETISTPETGVDTLSQSVDNGVSAAEPTGNLVANDTSNQNNLLSSSDNEEILQYTNTVEVSNFDELNNAVSTGDKIIKLKNDINSTEYKYLTCNVENILIDGQNHYMKNIFLTVSSLFIFKNINFDSTYPDLQSDKSRFIFINDKSHDIVVDNCTFSNSKSTGNGASIYPRGNNYNINITNCFFYKSECSVSGGAICFAGGCYDNNLINCTFIDCTSHCNGGAVELYSSNTLVKNCIFSNNTINFTNIVQSSNGVGGALNLLSGASNVHFQGCEFYDNKVIHDLYGQGGAFGAKFNNNFNTTIEDCIFERNDAKQGGAIRFNAANSTIRNCYFNNNTGSDGGAAYFAATNCNIENSNFIANNAINNGGAVYFNSNNCTINDCLFTNNTADNGGAVEFLGSKCDIIYCDFTNNSATTEGGAVQFNGQNNFMGYCNYTNNSAIEDGGALCAKNTGTTVAYCTFNNNTAPTGKDFYSHGYKITFEGLKFTTLWLTNKNLVDEDKIINYGYGTSYDYAAAWEDDYADSGFLDTYLDTNNGKCTIYLVGNITSLPEKLLSIPNLEIIGYDPVNNPVGATLNMDGWNHRAFTVGANNIKFTNITFKNSNITEDTSNPNGGVIYITANNTLIDGCSFYNNSAVNGSCIIMVSGDILTVDNCTFNGNNASYGGAIYINNCTNQSMIYTSTFENNVAYLGAGIYYNETMWYTEEDNTYKNNKITNTDSEMISKYTDVYDLEANRTYRIVYVKIGGDGLGNEPEHPTTFAKGFDMVAPNGQIVFVENGETHTYPGISRTNGKFGITFTGNNTTLIGITFINSIQGYNVTITDFHFVNNDSCVIWQGRDGNIVNCTFTSKDESALILTGEANSVDITNSSFINNTNRALTIETHDVVLDNCTFKNNTVNTGSGSHILMTNNATNIIVKDSRFIEGNNTGILVNASNVEFSNSNFTDNTGENGGAIQQINGILSLNGNIFEGNNATDNGGALNLVNGTSSLNDNNFINNTANNDGGAIYNNATLIIDGGSFTGNNASNGGAVYNNAALSIDGGSFTGNNASNGGAVYNDAALNVNDAVFKGNNATLGGALYLNNSASIKDSSFEGNTAVNGSAIYLTKDNLLELDNVVLKDNTYTEPNDETYGSIYLNNPKNEVLTYKNLNLVDKNDIYDGNYYLNTIYISSNGSPTAWGRDPSEATTLDNAVKHILDNGKIIVTDDSGDFTLNQTFNNLTNVTIVGNNKKFKTTDGKYLFNPPKKIKNLSLNNYLSS